MTNESKQVEWSEEDYRNWDKLGQQCDTIKGLNEIEIQKAKRAFQFLKDELGAEFLATAFAEGHPIVYEIINLVALTRRRITDLAEYLANLKDQENYRSLLVRIKDRTRYHEAVSVLEVAQKFFKVGYKVGFDPEISGKQPDLRIFDSSNDETSFTEVAVQGESRNRQEALSTLMKVQRAITSIDNILWCGRIKKPLAEQHLQEIIGRITQLSERVKRLNHFQELTIEDTVDFAMAPINDIHIIGEWAASKNMNVNSLNGPPYDSNEILRVKRKIEKEQIQLPEGYPNILVIGNPMVFQYCPDIGKLIGELEEEIYRYPQLLAVIIYGGYTGHSNPFSRTHDQHLYIEKTRYDILVEQYVLLLNRFCNVRITSAIIPQIMTAFSRY